MNSYRSDFTDNDVKTTEVDQPFSSEEGMSLTLPNDTHIFGINIFDSARILLGNKFSAARAADVKAAGCAAVMY